MAKPLSQQTIVITGASSGIGLATAQRAAAAGARLVLSARDGAALERAAQRLREVGAQVLVQTADVARREDLQTLADAAAGHFGGIDTWINNAGVGLFGSVLHDYDEDAARRLVDVNFWGMVHGSLVAVPYLRQRRGTLINVASMAADRAVPQQTVYSASKHAVKGFTDGLRQELMAEGASVAVVLVKPASIATPLTSHAAHPAGRTPRLVPPLYAPDVVARALLHAAEHPQRDVHVGAAARMGGLGAALAPGLMDLSAGVLSRLQWHDAPQARGSQGNLHQPPAEAQGRTLGDHPGQRPRDSLYTRFAQQPAGLRGVVWGLAAGAAWAAIEAASQLRSGRR